MSAKNFARRFSLAALLLLVVGGAQAFEVVVAKVVMVEPSYMPSRILFRIDKSLPSCPAGTFLKWEKSTENNKAVLASLLTAIASGHQIVLHIADGDSSCRGEFFHVL